MYHLFYVFKKFHPQIKRIRQNIQVRTKTVLFGLFYFITVALKRFFCETWSLSWLRTFPFEMQIEHYLQVVKTELVSSRYYQEFKLLEEYEYTAHSSLVHSLDIPVAKFHFEPSAMQVGIIKHSHFVLELIYSFWSLVIVISGLSIWSSKVFLPFHHQCLCYHWWCFHGLYF